MEIVYTGPKDTKTVNFSNGNQREYVFLGSEPLEVTEAEHLRFFLHPDRKGLFVREGQESTRNQNAAQGSGQGTNASQEGSQPQETAEEKATREQKEAKETEIKKVKAMNKEELTAYAKENDIEYLEGINKAALLEVVLDYINEA